MYCATEGMSRICNPVLYREVQKMDQLWIRIAVGIPVVISWYGAYQQLILRKPFGNNPAPDWMMLVLLVVFGAIFPLFFHSLKMSTEVRKEGLYIRFHPFHFSFRTFPIKTIRSCEVITYNPIRDYGGWGIRYGLKGTAYNVKGNRGVLFEFSEGNKAKRLMIGSQTPEKLSEAVNRAIKMQN
ncbi:DUF6141 family protein [Methanosarcina mazei]|jgi:hypothetical protein|uniref:Bacterial Pleckstrin homology domain-containing protein n=8 Tax=Methanosarcina mazei TaxID=2209 RepID=M1QNC3_METMZ|nr:DUF6141 family protein [Methanosarcina mazei]AGF98509.1 hypothetical protein MmTuc01_3252 [Methanosarcina mazei Tuc01]AKB40472.1 hypothetical protein MSMAW_1481 [Methanosarcina mazei WWM610]AKB61428.1 hypothetical protein MSMAP_1443 [Methanosarcina mazei SarPi]AKB64725.1 hypothetical protein MSMAS_1529 [Methanosarcina mazei S-6]AKB68268.1 hypothetical protein MSMAL_1725 [Methanosarcina mazei LYC]